MNPPEDQPSGRTDEGRDNGPRSSSTGGESRQARPDERLIQKSSEDRSDQLLKEISAATEPQAPLYDNPLEATFLYEPQGELLNERNKQIAANEFSIPDPIGTSITPLNPLEALLLAKDAPIVAGTKRKLGLEDTGSNSPTAKRPSLGTRRTHTGSQSGLRGKSIAEPIEMVNEQRDGGGPSVLQERRLGGDENLPMVLPARKVFPIQIGDKLFRLSGASISSDAPSYFSQFFEEQLRQNTNADNVRTLYIDRDPTTFEDISLHLQGYHVEPRDGSHFVKLFADAQFFSLPRLTAQLFSSSIYIRIGSTDFQVPRDLFSSPGDSPNYFTLGFQSFFATPSDAFPGLTQRNLLRPPSLLPPSVPNRSARTFADLVHVLKGYPLEIRSEEHRAELLRDARYFHLKGLEQKLIPHCISRCWQGNRAVITIRVEDMRASGVSFRSDCESLRRFGAEPLPPPGGTERTKGRSGSIWYRRPYVDNEPRMLRLESRVEGGMTLWLRETQRSHSFRTAKFKVSGHALAQLTTLLSAVSSKLGLPPSEPIALSEVEVKITPATDITLDGSKWPAFEEIRSEEDEDMEDDINYRTDRPQDKSRYLPISRAHWMLDVSLKDQIEGGGNGKLLLTFKMLKLEVLGSLHAANAATSFL